MTTPIINKVSESGLITLDLETYFPKNEIMVFDLKPMLFMELMLKEKDFRQSLQTHDWTQYQDKIVAVTCSSDAIIPVWAYMLVASNLQPYAKDVIFGSEEDAQKQVLQKRIQELNPADYQDQRVVVKGCGELEIGAFAYLEATKLLRPVAKSIMYGEPCSTVPVYKKK
ncbi:MAG: DUF2480 family protein [Chitinophagaceae bacterium]|uniref:DUF2480 family protein n=1 Tax=unclassified Paraflavitalea TaxID=2798305 RepID=UPI003D3482EF|nr:DUF2480 family protein [Chitinophagaceae bacterium]